MTGWKVHYDIIKTQTKRNARVPKNNLYKEVIKMNNISVDIQAKKIIISKKFEKLALAMYIL